MHMAPDLLQHVSEKGVGSGEAVVKQLWLKKESTARIQIKTWSPLFTDPTARQILLQKKSSLPKDSSKTPAMKTCTNKKGLMILRISYWSAK